MPALTAAVPSYPLEFPTKTLSPQRFSVDAYGLVQDSSQYILGSHEPHPNVPWDSVSSPQHTIVMAGLYQPQNRCRAVSTTK